MELAQNRFDIKCERRLATHQQQNLSQDKYAEYYIPNHAVTSHDNHFGNEK